MDEQVIPVLCTHQWVGHSQLGNFPDRISICPYVQEKGEKGEAEKEKEPLAAQFSTEVFSWKTPLSKSQILD